MEKEELAKELIIAASPLVNFIRKNYTPMTTVIVTGVNVEVLNTEINVPVEDEWD